jgi:ABC-type multidrug transport system fused ATPase/permease subunit
VLHGGHVVETGTHQQLLALDGHYAHLYKLGFKS